MDQIPATLDQIPAIMEQFASYLPENITTGTGSTTEDIMELRRTILNFPPIFKVPMEMSSILFVLVNIYKGLYVCYDFVLYEPYRTQFAIFFLLAMALEMPLVGHPAVIFAAYIPWIILGFMITQDEGYFIVLVPLIINFSQPLAIWIDFYIMKKMLDKIDRYTPVPRIMNLSVGYFLFCTVTSMNLELQLTKNGLTIIAWSLIAAYILSTIVYLYLYMLSRPPALVPPAVTDASLFDRWFPLGITVIGIEIVVYMFFPFIIDVLCKYYYGEKLTYSFPIFKSL